MLKYIWIIILSIAWVIWTVYVFYRFIKDLNETSLYFAFVWEPIMWWIAGHLLCLFVVSFVEFVANAIKGGV